MIAKGITKMPASGNSDCITVGIAQISPVWLDRERTLDTIIEYVESAAREECHLVVFGEALLPGYPFWIELTDGARFNYIDPSGAIRKERQNFDPAGHYARPDVTRLTVNRQRQSTLKIVD
jgi:hypothetical protein